MVMLMRWWRLMIDECFFIHDCNWSPELSMGWVDPRVGLGHSVDGLGLVGSGHWKWTHTDDFEVDVCCWWQWRMLSLPWPWPWQVTMVTEWRWCWLNNAGEADERSSSRDYILPSWKAVNSTQWSKRALSLWCAVSTGSRWDCIAQSRLVVQLFVLCARRQRGMTDTQPSNSQTRYSLHFTTLHFISSWSYTSGNVVVWLALKFLSRQINSAAAASAYWRANWYSRSVCLSGRMSRSGILWKRLNLLS